MSVNGQKCKHLEKTKLGKNGCYFLPHSPPPFFFKQYSQAHKAKGNLIVALLSLCCSQICWYSVATQQKTRLAEAGKPIFVCLLMAPLHMSILTSRTNTQDSVEKQDSTVLGTESLYKERRSLSPRASVWHVKIKRTCGSNE